MLRRWLVFRPRNGRFSGLKSDLRMGAVTERLFRRRAAATERKRALGDVVRLAVPFEQRHIVTFDEIRPVLAQFNRCHLRYPIFCMAERNSVFPFVLPILSSSSSIASTGDSGFSTLRSTQMRMRSSFGISSSSLRVPLF